MRILLLLFLMAACFFPGKAAPVPVQYRVNAYDQPDTAYGFVKEFSMVIRQLLYDRKIVLWTSTEKKDTVHLNFSADFSDPLARTLAAADHIYFYEDWQVESRQVVTRTRGLMLAGKTSMGAELVIGYVDYTSLEPFLRRLRVSSNADGNYNTTFEEVIALKKFNYTMVRYGRKKIKTPEASSGFIAEMRAGKSFNPAFVAAPPQKLVVFAIENVPGTEPNDQHAGKIFDVFAAYLSENYEEFLNLGGDGLSGHLQRVPLGVNALMVYELWEKKETVLLYPPHAILIFVNGRPMDILDSKELDIWSLGIPDRKVLDVIREKNYILRVVQVNDQPVSEDKAALFLDALMTGSWNDINGFVSQH